jgi:hypothetical protein
LVNSAIGVDQAVPYLSIIREPIPRRGLVRETDTLHLLEVCSREVNTVSLEIVESDSLRRFMREMRGQSRERMLQKRIRGYEHRVPDDSGEDIREFPVSIGVPVVPPLTSFYLHALCSGINMTFELAETGHERFLNLLDATLELIEVDPHQIPRHRGPRELSESSLRHRLSG